MDQLRKAFFSMCVQGDFDGQHSQEEIQATIDTMSDNEIIEIVNDGWGNQNQFLHDFS